MAYDLSAMHLCKKSTFLIFLFKINVPTNSVAIASPEKRTMSSQRMKVVCK